MFLQEKLLYIARNTDLHKKEDIINSINMMLNECLDSIKNDQGKNLSYKCFVSSFKRVNKTWKEVADILDRENFYFIERDGFKNYVQSKEEFKTIKL